MKTLIVTLSIEVRDDAPSPEGLKGWEYQGWEEFYADRIEVLSVRREEGEPQ